MVLRILRSSARASHTSWVEGFNSQAAQPHLEDRSTYYTRPPTQLDKIENHHP